MEGAGVDEVVAVDLFEDSRSNTEWQSFDDCNPHIHCNPNCKIYTGAFESVYPLFCPQSGGETLLYEGTAATGSCAFCFFEKSF